MTAITWILRFLLFLLLFGFALQNTQPVVLHIAFDRAWQAPLVLAILAAFLVGALLGAAALLGQVWRLRREVSRLRDQTRSPAATAEPIQPSVDA